jgi:hypothetical protein
LAAGEFHAWHWRTTLEQEAWENRVSNGLRILGARFACLAVIFGGASGLATGCASSDEDVVDFKNDGSAGSTGGFAGSSSTGGSSGFGGSFGSSGSGTGGFGTGGSGTGGFGTGGSGTGGFGTGGSSGGGTCNPAFCPNSGVGTPCCQAPDGPCGVDNGMGCQAVQDF